MEDLFEKIRHEMYAPHRREFWIVAAASVAALIVVLILVGCTAEGSINWKQVGAYAGHGTCIAAEVEEDRCNVAFEACEETSTAAACLEGEDDKCPYLRGIVHGCRQRGVLTPLQ